MRGLPPVQPLALPPAVPLAAAAFVAGVFLLQRCAALPSAAVLAATAAASALAGVAALLTLPRWPRTALVLLMLATGCAGVAYAALRAEWRMTDQLPDGLEGRDVVVVGVVDSLPAQLERGLRFELAVEQAFADDQPVRIPSRVALSWYGPQAQVVPAERWRFTVRLRRPHGVLNPGGFDLEAWLLENGLRATGTVRDGRLAQAPQRLQARTARPGALVDRARAALRESLQQRLQDDRYGGVLIALVLGDQRAIAERDWQLFNRTGISHLVSISGLHITMIAGLAALAAGALWRRSRRLLPRAPVQTAAAVAGLLVALLYCLLAGWGVPAQRTFYMLAAVAICLLLRRPLRPSATLSAAALVVTALDPWAVIAPGFWLSFGAVGIILLATPGRPPVPAPDWRQRLRDAAQMQLAITLGLVPLTVALFQQVSVLSPLANAVAIPVVSLLVTPLALAAACLVVLPQPLASLADLPLALAHTLMLHLAQGLQGAAQWAWASVAVPAPPAWAVMAAVAGVAWLLAPAGWPVRWLGLLPVALLFVLPAERPAPGALWVTAFDVGQGSAVLVESREHRVLYDTGPRLSPQADAGSRVLLPYLRWRGIGRIDLLVVSHLDNDHSGGAASLLGTMPVQRILSSVPSGHGVLANRASEPCLSGQRIQLGALALHVLHPHEDDYARSGRSTNAMSCVLRVDAGGVRVLLAGDIPSQQEDDMLARGEPLQAALLLAPHHGSRHSSGPAFIQASAARWAVFQAGWRNRYGHPDLQVLQRYAQAGTAAVRTDLQGAVQWRFHADGRVDLHAMRTPRQRYWHHQPGAEPPAAWLLQETPGAPQAGLVEPQAPEGSLGPPEPDIRPAE